MKRESYTESQLLEAIASGGKACDKAMKFLYQEHLDAVCHFIRARGGSMEEAKDIFQDALVSTLINIQQGRFEGKSSLGTYLFAVSKNLWFRKLKRNSVEEKYASSLAEEIDMLGPVGTIVEAETKARLDELLRLLKDKCKEVLFLWAQKYSMKEIASKLGYTSEQVVRNKKNLCLKEFKELVRERPEIRDLLKEII